MKLIDFTKALSSYSEKYGTIKTELVPHRESVFLEISIEIDHSTPFEFKHDDKQRILIAIIDLEEQYGIKESYFNNVPEEIRAKVFDTVIEFTSTPPSRR